ncbi:MAG: PDZ domain-containing protein, partial [Actinobacteria bacterium]|nr:PDZ domain-containing protein [Actinomycetota bacterium]
PRLGVQVLRIELPAFLRRANREAAQRGLVIGAVEGDSPAEGAGLLVGDVLLGVGDETPDDVEALLDAIARAGDAVRLRVMRGGKISFVSVNPGAPGRAA